MGLKIQLIKNNQIILELPLDMEEWQPETLKRELQSIETRLPKIVALHNILSNKTRIRMLCELARTFDSRFSELIEDIDANQKIISESLRRMIEEKLIERVEKKPREVHYNPSPLGFASLLTTCIVTNKIMDEIRKEQKNQKECE